MGLNNKISKVIYFVCCVILPIAIGLVIYKYKNEAFINAWIKYNLADGLWVFSFSSCMLYVWAGERKTPTKIFWVLIPMLSAVGFELSQFIFNIGTFDILDILWYGLGYLLSICIFLFITNQRSIRKLPVTMFQR